ncbi:hypothetical protein PRIPAC_88374 [Pristionchus pacificus]|uniref:Phospholipase B-like n=1 Tax=Pristionchus pacificus TaxID=54126 RepID=A0A2A6CIU6_PRIPA|nr:hypothetical protein PRIPAC_88374 [Pristionchus pacificus]|eukprot:PDM78059.1 hypothetical protein PRIPAC_30444 [Pristionchus pacificus]
MFLILLFFTLANCRNLKKPLVEYNFCTDINGSPYVFKRSSSNEQCENDVAKIQYINAINSTGWASVDIEISSEDIPEWQQAYAAGFLEGRSTRHLISDHAYNLLNNYCKETREYCDRAFDFLLRQFQFMRLSIENSPRDPYWKQVEIDSIHLYEMKIKVNFTLTHLVGMVDGYDNTLMQSRSDEQLVKHKVFLIQLQAEIWDLEAKFNRPKWMSRRRGHCSALVKLLSDRSDILFAHTTWDSLSSLLRVQKRLRFKLSHLPGAEYSYSGYPGTLASIDDFYMSGSNLAITETTNELYTTKLYDRMKSTSVPTWIRSQISTRMASTGDEWAIIFGKHNSGTYNNQWIIVDYNKFDSGLIKLLPGTLTIIEQMPGALEYADMTSHLDKKSFWSSYNRPFFPQMFSLGGFAEMEKKYGEYFSYNETARSKIFRREQHKVVDFRSLHSLMRLNNYLSDPLSQCSSCSPHENAEYAIASRNDLNPRDGKYPYKGMEVRDMAATDVKYTSSSLPPLSFISECGPTHDSLPPFDWSESDLNDVVRHRGQPKRWNFHPIHNMWSDNSLYESISI